MTNYNGSIPIFDLPEEYGSSVSYLFNSNPIKKGSINFCYSNAEKLYPLAEYEISVKFLSSYDYARDFFVAVNGGQDVFCFLDPVDHYAKHDVYFTGLGVKTWGVIVAVDGKLRLAKRYYLDTDDSNSYEITRLITRPKENGIVVYNGANIASVSVDWDTGEVLSGGAEGMTWSGYFYTPVRFANDLLPLKAISFRKDINGNTVNHAYDLESIILQEVREADDNYGIVVNNNYQHTWRLGFERTYSSDLSTKTHVYKDGAEFEQRTATALVEVEHSFPDLELVSYSQKEYLITLWRLCLGSHNNFIINDSNGTGYNGYFYFSQPFSIKSQTYISEFEQIFLVSGLKFREKLSKTNTTYCHCWLLTRKDGTQYAFTNHDRKLIIDTVEYLPRGSYKPSSPTRTAESTETQDMDLSSFLTETITEEDILTNRFLDTEVILFYYDWLNLATIGRLFTGQIKSSEIDYLPSGANSYKFLVKSYLENLNTEIKVETSSTCRAKFLSPYCGRAIDGNVRTTRTITSIGNGINSFALFIDSPLSGFNRGMVTFTSGKLEGMSIPLTYMQNNQEIPLLWKPPILPEVGDTIEITKYCGKTTNDCATYNNIAGFRGEPSLTGLDKIRSVPS